MSKGTRCIVIGAGTSIDEAIPTEEAFIAGRLGFPDRGGVPSGSAPRRAFAHGFELGGDLLERAIGRCRLDAGDQPDQPVVAGAPSRAIQQVASTMPSEASRRTVRRSRSTVQSLPRTGSGVPALPRFRTRTTSPQGWSGRIRRTVGSPESSCASTASRWAASRLARTLRIASGSPARRPGLPPTRPRARGAARRGADAPDRKSVV